MKREMPRPFTEESAAWVRRHCAEIERGFSPFFEARAAVFPRWWSLLERLRAAEEAVLDRGWPRWRQVDEAHNEMCAARAILANPRSLVRRLDYELPLDDTPKTIDFLVAVEGRIACYVDVKTIAPTSLDRWDHFEQARRAGRFGDPSMLVLEREWLGGEIYHAWFAARTRMLEYTLEDKASLGRLVGRNVGAVLLLCSNGFDWHEDALEDFVAFYTRGRHRFDDPFAAMERYHIAAKGLDLPRRLRNFAYLERPSGSLDARKVSWNVTPPKFDRLAA